MAGGFGVATLFGPPEFDSTNYRPTVTAYDGLPSVENPTAASELMSSNAATAGDQFRLRTDTAQSPMVGNGSPAARGYEAPAAVERAHRPIWGAEQPEPQWLQPARGVEPTSLLVDDDDRGVEFASAEQEVTPPVTSAEHPFHTPTSTTGWPAQNPLRHDAARQVAPANVAAANPFAHEQAWDSAWPHTAQSSPASASPASSTSANAAPTNVATPWSDDRSPRPVYQTNNWFDNPPSHPVPPTGIVQGYGASNPAIETDSPGAGDVSAEPPMDVHIVTDGDSLPKLAARYLDDASRSWEIFQLNRDLLRSPELLPIGAVLKLPSPKPPTTDMADGNAPAERSVLVSQPSPTPTSPALMSPGSMSPALLSPESTAAEFVGSGSYRQPARLEISDDGMVPIQPLAPGQQRVPHARLLRPVPVDWIQNERNPQPYGQRTLRDSSVSFVEP
jgi:hypothetical protein